MQFKNTYFEEDLRTAASAAVKPAELRHEICQVDQSIRLSYLINFIALWNFYTDLQKNFVAISDATIWYLDYQTTLECFYYVNLVSNTEKQLNTIAEDFLFFQICSTGTILIEFIELLIFLNVSG